MVVKEINIFSISLSLSYPLFISVLLGLLIKDSIAILIKSVLEVGIISLTICLSFIIFVKVLYELLYKKSIVSVIFIINLVVVGSNFS